MTMYRLPGLWLAIHIACIIYLLQPVLPVSFIYYNSYLTPKIIPATSVCCGIKLNDDENVRFMSLFLQSGMNEMSKFIKSMLFGSVIN
ncbi:plasmid mobilization protein [Dysgonomonas reticulitermitis]